MTKKTKKTRANKAKKPSGAKARLNSKFQKFNFFQKILLGLVALIFLFFAVNYTLAYYYQYKHRNDPMIMGTTFVPRYARYLGVDPKETFDALVNDAGFKHLRLVSYWDDIEKTPGVYDFSELDWQFEKAQASGARISLAIGLRQPRWPECHMPAWHLNAPLEQWGSDLFKVLGATVERYKDHPNLESYQLENEFFLKVFGECPDFTRDRLIREYNYVKSLDDNTPIVVSRSNNALGFPIGQPRPDQFGVSVYKRVWDKTITKRYFEYPFPAKFYGMLAGGGELITGKPLIIHELQMEAWLPGGQGFSMNDVNSVPEQNKSMNAERLKDRFDYGRESGIRTIYTWGSEWWYWRKVKANDPSLWNVAKEEVAKANAEDYSAE